MNNLVQLYIRDLKHFVQEVESTPAEILWQKKNGITNTCGILAQHVAGNLKHFLGTMLGDTGYVRDREKEFTNTGISVKELKQELLETAEMVETVLLNVSDAKLADDAALEFPWGYSPQKFILHLYGHLNYHRGQFNYLRRILDEN